MALSDDQQQPAGYDHRDDAQNRDSIGYPVWPCRRFISDGPFIFPLAGHNAVHL